MKVDPKDAKYSDLENHETFKNREDLRSGITRMFKFLGSEQVLDMWWYVSKVEGGCTHTRF